MTKKHKINTALELLQSKKLKVTTIPLTQLNLCQLNNLFGKDSIRTLSFQLDRIPNNDDKLFLLINLLILAARNNMLDHAAMLLSKNTAIINMNEKQMNSFPLLWAVGNGHQKMVELLLQAGADPRKESLIKVRDQLAFTIIPVNSHITESRYQSAFTVAPDNAPITNLLNRYKTGYDLIDLFCNKFISNDETIYNRHKAYDFEMTAVKLQQIEYSSFQLQCGNILGIIIDYNITEKNLRIQISDIEYHVEYYDCIGGLYRDNSFASLKIIGNNSTISYIIDPLSGNKTIKELNIFDDSFGFYDKQMNSISIVRLLQYNTTLTKITIGSISRIEDLKLIIEALCDNKTIKTLCLNQCEIELQPDSILAKTLQKNQSLSQLIISQEHIEASTVSVIVNSLQKSNIIKITLRYSNDFKDSDIIDIYNKQMSSRYLTIEGINHRGIKNLNKKHQENYKIFQTVKLAIDRLLSEITDTLNLSFEVQEAIKIPNKLNILLLKVEPKARELLTDSTEFDRVLNNCAEPIQAQKVFASIENFYYKLNIHKEQYFFINSCICKKFHINLPNEMIQHIASFLSYGDVIQPKVQDFDYLIEPQTNSTIMLHGMSNNPTETVITGAIEWYDNNI